ncbi:alanine racemase [Devosia sp. RR2S18]|uniref:alanine racemase n=1 Tax=Devosia rhizosphaerae TaxID=3049774 RepID=UPI002542363B|nr:alanine racemase [Devosia sp. RR2S18]WIJ25812.1 alanine racemase [Devosia sp. RR2S18]
MTHPIEPGLPLPKLTDVTVDYRSKGLPGDLTETSLSALGGKGWNILGGDLPLPLATLDLDAIEHNSRFIRAVTGHYKVSLCPHGKTTMSPQLFHKQIEDGCWGITLSTPHQVHVARHYGQKRIFLANQILDPVFLNYIAKAQAKDPDFDFYFLIDSPEGVDALERAAAQQAGHRPFQVLVEMGSSFGRAGCRTSGEALALAERVAAMSRAAMLVGIEGFEGSIRGEGQAQIEERILDFLGLMTETARQVEERGLFGGREILLTAGGSSFFDLVARALSSAKLSGPTRVVLRSGCYITHDAGMYKHQIDRAMERSPELDALGIRPRQALTVWAVVQSRPEDDLLFLNVGRRDVSYDSHLPEILGYVADGVLSPVGAGHEPIALNDQHAFVRCPPESPLRPGMVVQLGISHPCTTFDKWDVLLAVDRSLNVIGAVKTFF